jgi:hypothetical protein
MSSTSESSSSSSSFKDAFGNYANYLNKLVNNYFLFSLFFSHFILIIMFQF